MPKSLSQRRSNDESSKPWSNRFQALQDIVDVNSGTSTSTQRALNRATVAEFADDRDPQQPNGAKPARAKERRTTRPSDAHNSSGSIIAPDAAPSRPTKTSKPPPMNVVQQEVQATIRLIREHAKVTDFSIKRLSAGKHAIYTQKLGDFNQILNVLKNARAKFYTFTPKEQKTVTVLLKGIAGDSDPDDILAELAASNLPNVQFVKVNPFATKKSKNENIALPMLLVQLSPGSQFSQLHNIKHVAHQVVRWEKLKRSDSIQCKRCQRLGHVASNCNMAYRCVKCNEGHEPGQCSLNDESAPLDRQKLFCVTCGSYGHPASYRGCPVLVENRKKNAEKLKLVRENRERVFRRQVAGMQYADALKIGLSKTQAAPAHQTEGVTCAAAPSSQPQTDILNILEEFKSKILNLFAEQLAALKQTVDANTSKINALSNIFQEFIR